MLDYHYEPLELAQEGSGVIFRWMIVATIQCYLDESARSMNRNLAV